MNFYTRKTGHLAWINIEKCHGYIQPLDGSNGVVVDFAYLSQDIIAQYKKFKNGQEVSFQVEKGHKDSHAINITAV